MKFPKVGEEFYWKTMDGVIIDDICQKIENDDNPELETLFFTYISPNGGGEFVCESDILDPSSKEVQEYKKILTENKVNEIKNYLKNKDIRSEFFEKLIKKAFTNNEANKILNILTYD